MTPSEKIHSICERCWIDRASTWVPIEGTPLKTLKAVKKPSRIAEFVLAQCCYCCLPTIVGYFVSADLELVKCGGIHSRKKVGF